MAAGDADGGQHTSYRAMASSSEGPNPLRPYYIPPSIGIPHDSSSQQQSRIPGNYTSRATSPPRPKTANLRSSARDYLSDLDYGDYLPDRSPSMGDMVKRLMDQAVWNYTSVLLAQPFEVAKTLLQIHIAQGGAPAVHPRLSRQSSGFGLGNDPRRPGIHRDGASTFAEDFGFEVTETVEDESDSDSPSYFTSTAPRVASPAYPGSPAHHFPSTPSRSGSYRRQAKPPSRSNSTTPTPGATGFSAVGEHRLELRAPDAVLEVIGQVWQKEAAWGVWKGTNMTFVYNILLRTIEAWMRSVLSALVNLPEAGTALAGAGGSSLAASAGGAIGSAGGLDILDSPSPLTSLGVAVAAAGITGLILCPLDVLRTRLIVSSTTAVPRAILPSFRLLPSLSQLYHSLLPSTLLHSTIPSFFSNSAPLVLRSVFHIDPILTPALYSVASFGASVCELFVRLPLETVLRRGQVDVIKEETRRRQLANFRDQQRGRSGGPRGAPLPDLKPIVEPGPFRGVVGTMWFIVREEGFSAPTGATAKSATASGAASPRVRKGQGVKGLVRGWRVGFWGLVGVWGAAALNSGNPGGEF